MQGQETSRYSTIILINKMKGKRDKWNRRRIRSCKSFSGGRCYGLSEYGMIDLWASFPDQVPEEAERRFLPPATGKSHLINTPFLILLGCSESFFNMIWHEAVWATLFLFHSQGISKYQGCCNLQSGASMVVFSLLLYIGFRITKYK